MKLSVLSLLGEERSVDLASGGIMMGRGEREKGLKNE